LHGKSCSEYREREGKSGDNGPKSRVEVIGAERAWFGIDKERRGRYFWVGNKRRKGFRMGGCN
jgi:hypothetical protein